MYFMVYFVVGAFASVLCVGDSTILCVCVCVFEKMKTVVQSQQTKTRD